MLFRSNHTGLKAVILGCLFKHVRYVKIKIVLFKVLFARFRKPEGQMYIDWAADAQLNKWGFHHTIKGKCHLSVLVCIVSY